MSAAPSTDEILRALRAQGWHVTQTNRGHWKCKPAGNSQMVVFSETGDPHGQKNALSHLRRAGFQWPWPPAAERQRPAPIPAVAGPTDVDSLFKDLKEARARLATVMREHDEVLKAKDAAARALEEASQLARMALEDVDRARRAVAEKKALFDDAFDVEVPK